MAKKKENSLNEGTVGYYGFEPSRTLTLEEVTLLLQKIVGHWRMTEEQYNALPDDLKDVFVLKID